MKYNKSEIMKTAWSLYRLTSKGLPQYRRSFASCLKQAWAIAKENVEMHKTLRSCVRHINGMDLEIRHGMTASGFEGWMVTGKTYNFKRALRKAGFQWDAEGRYWETRDFETAKRFMSI